MTCPPKDTRQKIWSHFIPANIKLDSDVSFLELSKKYELQPGSIAMAIQRAISYAFTRSSSSSSAASASSAKSSLEKSGSLKSAQITVHQKDFIQAADCEVEKFKSGNYELLAKLFT